MEPFFTTPTGQASQIGEPAWEVAHFFPLQGKWKEHHFLALATPHRFELVNGRLEMLPMPSWFHQNVVFFLCEMLRNYLRSHPVGMAVIAPMLVRLAENQIRQPDVVFAKFERIDKDRRKTQEGADLVMEVVSPGEENRERDLVAKRAAYAAAGIAEYWIVDPETNSVTVLALATDGNYQTAGVYGKEEPAASVLLPGFMVDVTALFAAGEQ